jgi:sugar phosphate permease
MLTANAERETELGIDRSDMGIEIANPDQSLTEVAKPRFSLRHWQIAVVFVVYLGYIGVLANRRSFSSILPVMKTDPDIRITSADVGVLFAVTNAVHMLAEFISGPLVDRLGGRLVFQIGTFIPALGTLAFSFARSVPLWGLALSVSRLFQAAVSPAVTKIVSTWFLPSEYGRAMGILNSATRIGAASSGVVIGLLILKERADKFILASRVTNSHVQGGLTWDRALWTPAVFLALASALSWLLLRNGMLLFVVVFSYAYVPSRVSWLNLP